MVTGPPSRYSWGQTDDAETLSKHLPAETVQAEIVERQLQVIGVKRIDQAFKEGLGIEFGSGLVLFDELFRWKE